MSLSELHELKDKTMRQSAKMEKIVIFFIASCFNLYEFLIFDNFLLLELLFCRNLA